jgi:hemerythrin-like metal-binding protein
MTIAELYPLHCEDMNTQHSRIHFMLEELAGAALSSGETAETKLLVDSSIQYTKLHFADEEQFMRSCGYPNRQAHEAEHVELIEQMEGIERQLGSRNHHLKDFLHSFRDRLERHTAQIDELYRDFCLQNGDQELSMETQ